MNQQLRNTLAALREEIGKLESNDVASKEKLEQLVQTLEKRLDNPDDDDLKLTEGLQDSVTHFEVTHPRVTAILNDFMMTLSNMGI